MLDGCCRARGMAAANKTPCMQQSKRFSFFLSHAGQRQIKTNAVIVAASVRIPRMTLCQGDVDTHRGTCILIEVLPLCGMLLVATILVASLASGCNAVVTSRKTSDAHP